MAKYIPLKYGQKEKEWKDYYIVFMAQLLCEKKREGS
jgi:hypothetical protein